MPRAPAYFALLMAAACPAPSDVTPMIHVDPRAAQRLAWLGERAAPAEEDPPAPSPARVHALKDGEQLGGSGATGRPGDWLLENAQVVFVIAQIGGDAGPDAGPIDGAGDLIDAADAHTRRDELGHMAPSFGATPPECVYASLRAGAGADGSAWIEVSGRGTSQPSLALTTRYTLHAPDRALFVETALENTGDAPIDLASEGDALEWGAAEKVAPGEARGFVGPSSGAYIGAVGVDASYALTSADGSIEAVSGTSWTQTAQRKKVTLASHERTSYARVLVVGERPDTTSLVGELALAAGLPVGEVKITVTGAVPGTTLALTPDGSTQALTLVQPFDAMLPEGRYGVAPAGGRGPVAPLDVKRGRVATVTVTVESGSGGQGLPTP